MPLSVDMLAALAQQGHVVGPVLTLTLPAGLGAELGLPDDYLRLASAPFCSSTEGWFDQRVYRFGRSTQVLSDRNGNLRRWDMSISTTDLPETDAPAERSIGPFGRAIKLANLRGAPASIRIAAEGVDPADWHTERVGVLASWSRNGDTGWTWNIRSDDEALKRPCPRLKLTTQDWPDAYQPPTGQEATVIGQYAPVALGLVDSTGLGEHGLRRTLYVDVKRNRYLVSLGTIGATGFRVYVDGLATTDPTYVGPTATREVIVQGGRTWTVITFNGPLGADPHAEQVVTVDCHGLDLGSYGTYTSPAAQFRWVLEHLVFNSWNGGAEISPTHTDTTSFTALASAMGTREGAPGWLTQGQEVSGEEMIRKFCASHGVDVWWNEQGEIAVDMLDPMQLDADASSNVYVQGGDNPRVPLELVTPPTEELWQHVTISYLQGSDGKPMADLSVCHPRALDAAPRAIVGEWLAGRVV